MARKKEETSAPGITEMTQLHQRVAEQINGKERKTPVYREKWEILADMSKQANTAAGYSEVVKAGMGRELRGIADQLEDLMIRLKRITEGSQEDKQITSPALGG